MSESARGAEPEEEQTAAKVATRTVAIQIVAPAFVLLVGRAVHAIVGPS